MTIQIGTPLHNTMTPHRRRPDPSALAAASLAHGETIAFWDGARARLGFAAATATTTQTAFVIRHSSGFLQIALPTPVCDRLLIPMTPPVPARSAGRDHRQCIGIDAAEGVTTGISAADRAQTARVLADPRTVLNDLIRPGHLMVVAVDPDHRGAVPRMALHLAETDYGGLVFADLVSPTYPDAMADERDAAAFAAEHRLALYDFGVKSR